MPRSNPLNKSTVIQVRKLLRQLRCHDAVRYSGPIWMMAMPGRPSVYMGEDYEFRDVYEDLKCNPWESERAFRPNTPTRKRMEKVIELLETHQPRRGFVIERYSACWLPRKQPH